MATRLSSSLSEAQTHVRSLYREVMRCVPYVRKIYQVDLPESDMRALLRKEFRKHPGIRDAAVVDMLVFKGKQEVEETLRQWKPRTTLLKYFPIEETLSAPMRETERRRSEFLQKFLAGY
ncbi:mitochondrial Complex I (CI) NADH:ubiquinone oxidoreductase subunit B14/NB4M/NDUFA6 [Andalucia godoyi]|uniref:Mitochondrial Complex I (CI) NADH:ubiquinone oxidoreductase subunit B14/NB4M/NDUFA6 n=1 Tax=Andalucia godoyi TaxID=505711 RepID=A0A8K0AH15_ANDGO|nr:mitochondrial Complex I (CI) NADH:ubiquinone oxidoreductase subunit B14/NB4M/NDUFA6 [Andalucia godoyi]|eukprot:ANDGO_06214.mRNA.1 mitochondrial Complex I (CI) NADH:ubiquinone oxidoreductase subunit B14/NB4M/NDUFA6